MIEHMLTTVDNPYDPSTHFDEWRVFDESHGYHTLSLLARIVRTSEDMSEADQSLAIEQGIDEIVRDNFSGMHKKVVVSSTSTSSS